LSARGPGEDIDDFKVDATSVYFSDSPTDDLAYGGPIVDENAIYWVSARLGSAGQSQIERVSKPR
jgi:hypothetical protein